MAGPIVRPAVRRHWVPAVLAAAVAIAAGCADDGTAAPPATAEGEAATTTAPPPPPDLLPFDPDQHPGGLACHPATLRGLDIPADAEVAAGSPTGRVQDWRGQYAAHWTEGETVVEVHLPGTVVIDLVGERTERVELASLPATLWYAGAYVQLRGFSGEPDTCRSFDVTVWICDPDGPCDAAPFGPEERRAAELALRVADQVAFADVDLDPAAAVAARWIEAVSAGDVDEVEALGAPGSPITRELVALAGEVGGDAYEVPRADGTVPLRVYGTAGAELESVTPGCLLLATVDGPSITALEPAPDCGGP